MFIKSNWMLTALAVQTVAFASPPITYTAVIRVDAGATPLGYVAPDPNYWTPLLTSDKNSALIVTFTMAGTSATQINLTSNDARGLYFGPVVGRDSTSSNIGPGSFNYLYLDPISMATAPGATPQSVPSYFSVSSGLDKQAETAVWSIDLNALTLALQWINTDSSTPLTVTFDQSNHLYAGGDAAAFEGRFPASVTSVTLHLEILSTLQGPTFTKTITTLFGAGSINQGDTAPVVFMITNPNSISLTALAFTDVLPDGLQIQSPNELSNTCGGTVTATSGTGTISLSGGTVAANSSCEVSVDATGVAQGPQTNPSVTLTSTQASTATSDAVTVFVYPWWLAFFY